MRPSRHTLATPRRHRRPVVWPGHPRVLLAVGYALTGAVLALGPTPAVAAPTHDHSAAAQAAQGSDQDPMAGHDMGSMTDEDMAGHDMGSMSDEDMAGHDTGSMTAQPAPTAGTHDMGSMSDEEMAGHGGAGHGAGGHAGAGHSSGHGEAASSSRPLGAVLGVFGAVILAVLVTAFVWRRRLASQTRTSRPRTAAAGA